MSRVLKAILAINVIVITILTFVYPNLMVGPGKLIPGHQALNDDCFACHAPLVGAQSARCVTCHKPQDIGRLATTGLAVTKPLTTTPFHQQLINQDCVACHSDHAGVKRFRSQGHFDHALLNTATRAQCQTCHKSPSDALHQPPSGNCTQCHSQEKWKPASIDHDRFFLLDRDHKTECVTCHVRNDYSRYTCYGCHEHTPAKIRREHVEEGIRSFENCVECHRSANKHDSRGSAKRKEGKHERKHRDDHD
jgi:hypothetical protein